MSTGTTAAVIAAMRIVSSDSTELLTLSAALAVALNEDVFINVRRYACNVSLPTSSIFWEAWR